jgi:hypothetical protein
MEYSLPLAIQLLLPTSAEKASSGDIAGLDLPLWQPLAAERALQAVHQRAWIRSSAGPAMRTRESGWTLAAAIKAYPHEETTLKP